MVGVLGKDFDHFIILCENADDVLFSTLLSNENIDSYLLLKIHNMNAQSASLRSFLCFVRVLKVYVNCRLE